MSWSRRGGSTTRVARRALWLPRTGRHAALLRQPLEHGVTQWHLNADVREQPLILHHRRQREPQIREALPRLAAHAVAEEQSWAPHTLLPQALQPLPASVLFEAYQR